MPQQWPGVPVNPAPVQQPTMRSDPVIAPPNPYKQADEDRARAAEQRAQQDQAFQAAADARAREDQQLQREKFQLDQQKAQNDLAKSPSTESERTAAFLATRVANSSRQLADAIAADSSAQSPSLGVETVRTIFGNTAANYVTDEQRQQVYAAQLDLVDALLTLGTGAAYTEEQKETYRRSYFPELGDSEATIADKSRRLRAAMEAARVKAGASAPDIDRAISAIYPEDTANAEDRAPPLVGGGLQAADGRIAGAGTDNGGNGSLGLTQGAYDQVNNPMLAGVREEYLARLGRGDSAQAIISWARQAGVEPRAFASIAQQVKFRRENPKVPLSQYDTSELDDMLVPMSGAEQAINSFAQSGPGAALIAAGDAASGFTLDNIVGATGGNAERARLGMDQIANANPGWNAVGTVAGGVGAAMGMEGALGAGGIAAGLPRMLAADALYGAAGGAGGTDYSPSGAPATLGERAAGAAKGAAAAAVGSAVGNKVGSTLARAASPASDASVRAINEMGIPTTVGQQYGRSGKIGAAVKGVEDRLSGLPVVGGVVTGRQREGVKAFNSKAFEKALEPIGGTVAGQVGEQAVASAQQQVSDAFTKALAGKGAVPDQEFAKAFSAGLLDAKSTPRLGDEVFGQIVDIFRAYDAGDLVDGEALQTISRELRDLKFAYRNDPLARRVGRAVDKTERALFDLFDRQASGTIPAYMDARRAYRRLSVLEDAVLRAKNTEGEFTPGQLGMADRTNAKRYSGQHSAAAGGGEFHDFQRAAQNVLPNRVPDSGTAGRVLIPLLATGAIGTDAATGDGVSPGVITVAAILGGAYSKPLQRLLTKPGRGIESQAVQGVLKNPATRQALGAGGAVAAIGTTNQQ